MKTPNRTLPALALVSILSLGCASLAVATQVPTATNGASAVDSNQPVTDSWITTKVKSELATTAGVKSMDISVKTVDGVVILTGVLATDVAVKKAIAAAGAVKGVKSVDATGLKSKS
jgi:hyperosmotically inducible protein